MKTVLITGANRGIGLQISQDLVNAGHKVYMGTRAKGRTGDAVDDLNATWVTIDVAEPQSIRDAADWFGSNESELDVLINNAGIYPDKGDSILDVSRDQFVETFQTNTFGVVEVTQAFLPFLRKADKARVVNLSSGYSQLEGLNADSPTYCLSKLALNGITIMLANKLKGEIAVNSVSPGWVRTDMGGSSADRSIEEGAKGTVWLATEASHELTGKFFRDQEEIDW